MFGTHRHLAADGTTGVAGIPRCGGRITQALPEPTGGRCEEVGLIMEPGEPSGRVDPEATTHTVDRRRFLKHAGIGAAAGGALWVAPSVLGAPPVFAAGTNPTGPDWTNMNPAAAPAARRGHAMVAYAWGPIVLFGGSDNWSNMGDTWTFDGTNWTRQHPQTSPRARAAHAMTESPYGKVLLYGGTDDVFPFNDTWIYDGTNWTQLNLDVTTVPHFRKNHAMATLRSGNVVLFGGITYNASTNEDADAGDTWIFDGAGWTQVHPQTSPSPRFNHAMATDASGNIVLFGGVGHLDDTWIFDGANWTQQHPQTSPPGRGSHAMAADLSGTIVLFSGHSNALGYLDDTWTWDGTNWTQQHPQTSPSTRYAHAMATADGSGNVTLFGGQGGHGSPLGDTWIWA